MALSRLFFFIFAILASFSLLNATDVSHDGRAIKIDGQRKILISGSIHYPRSTPQMWPDLIAKAKEGGLDAIETYVFWNAHEPQRGQYNFDGNLNIIRFLKEIKNAGMYAILRIGPYVCAEWNHGGLPAWLQQIPGMQFRTDNQPFKDEMQKFVTKIVDMVKIESLLAPQGGPIILTQIENEYGNVEKPFKDAGKRYILWSAQMAEALNVGVPWIMCQQDDAPQPMINTCNGFYCDSFKPNNETSPKMWTENWTGWFKSWDSPDPHRPAEDVAFAVARFFQRGGTLQNYYMYHGGTNFGRSAGGPYIVTSYDYDAPLNEFGNLNQPKWGHLKQLHSSIKLIQDALLFGDVNETSLGNGITTTKYSGNNITSACFLSNENSTVDSTISFEGNNFFVPSWSVSVLANCSQEIFNTAKVGTQTNVMVKKSNLAQDVAQLKWQWRPEILVNQVQGKHPIKQANALLEQVSVTADVSDYLWYITSVNNLTQGNMTLRVNTTGHGIYVFVNGVLQGSRYALTDHFTYVFETPIAVNNGTNIIALLSATVGLKNYGAFYETTPTGVVGGPVELISGNTTTDLSNSLWSYMVGFDGEGSQLYVDGEGVRWYSPMIPMSRPFTWYKTTFQVPVGSDPVVVDLQGMGKGVAWINGENIGRYWTNIMATSKNCTPCDYRGSFNAGRACNTGCNEIGQRWYHVPREYLKAGESNTLILFEEIGGNPENVSFQGVTVGTICGSVNEKETLNLTCEGGKISRIDFASFGDPKGTCQSFTKGSCEASGALDRIQRECVGNMSCSILADESLLGVCSPCTGNVSRRLTVQATCS
ncbi:uncharacterized protein A4U43_UnF4920 [Asparagus officinalis]|uniref:Beta-galactosidase n=1 Tax=Asparagus officinalis TaxID=4686 RepID=A0A1R3L6V5_ASPOF|nr:beta-galactosidase 1-like [Asparagus officinalis]ONK55324.1 uncharacterized protein A4U43_UnF4920 [Asparagus officinalis]